VTAADQHEYERAIALTGCFNFRDLGGYATRDGARVKWRRLFRADGLSRLTPEDLALLGELGLATVLDLRTSGELDQLGRFAGESGYHHLPMIDVLPDRKDFPGWVDPAIVAERYREMMSVGRDAIVSSLTVLSAPESYPAVFHCSAGKDRTGILAAVVLGLVGVPDEVIVADYALSAAAMEKMVAWFRSQSPERAEAIENYAPALVAAAPETMAAFIAEIEDHHGGFAGLAASLGVPDIGDRLRAVLLDELA
jgi:protein-tyrosine phosphatase